MSHITVIGGTGYAGAAVVAEAASRGHRVTALSTRVPSTPTPDVDYVQGDATDPAVLSSAIQGAEVVVAALAPRGALAASFREVNRTIARLAADAGARLLVVGGFSSLRPAPGERRFIEDAEDIPAAVRDEVMAGAALIIEDLPASPGELDWVFVSPPRGFGSFAPGETLGRYQLGDEVAVDPATGGAISAADYALGLVDLVEAGGHRRSQVNLAHPA